MTTIVLHCTVYNAEGDATVTGKARSLDALQEYNAVSVNVRFDSNNDAL